jgi:uncharacterized protein (TIGR03067 family)
LKPILYTLALIALTALSCRTSDVPSGRAEDLVGSWQLVYQKMSGTELPDETQAELFRGRMDISRNTINYSVALPGFDFTFGYQLFPDRDPKAIDLVLTQTADGKGIGEKVLGIYRVEGQTLEICYSKTDRPTDFTAEQGSGRVLIVLRRIRPD